MTSTKGIVLMKNPLKPHLKPVEAEAFGYADVYLCIPSKLRDQLELEEHGTRRVSLFDGSTQVVPYVGPVELHYKGRAGFFGAVVLGDRVGLGIIPMGDLDLVVL